jgi:prepilin-type processing-associated H-X9-DG protein
MDDAAPNSRCEAYDVDPIPFRFSLRSLFLLTAVVATVFGIWRIDNDQTKQLFTNGAVFIGSGSLFFSSLAQRKFTVAKISAAVFLGWIVVFLLLQPTVTCVMPPTPPCLSNMRTLSIALQLHEARYRTLPPAVITDSSGKPMHSWRVAILPYIEENEIYSNYRFNEPWNSPHNAKVTAKRPDLFHCPSDKQAGKQDTSYVAVITPKSAWGINQGKSLDGIRDGRDGTILLVEMKNSGIHWAEPRDLDLANLPPTIDKTKLFESLSAHPRGLIVAFADGHIEHLPFAHSSLEYLEAIVSRDGGEKIEWEKQMPRVVLKAGSPATKKRKTP